MVDPSEFFRVESHPSSLYPQSTASKSGWEEKDSTWAKNGQVIDKDLLESFIDDNLGWEGPGWRSGGWAEEGKQMGEISADSRYVRLRTKNGNEVFIPHKGGTQFVKEFYDSPETIELLARSHGNKTLMSINGLGEIDITGLEGLEAWWNPIDWAKKALEVAKKVLPFVPKPQAPQPPLYTPPPQQYIPPGQQYVPGQQYQVPSPYLHYTEPKKMNPWIIGGISVGGLVVLGTIIFLVSKK